MVAIGRWLPPGTLVHGKLANGLALESRITPVFVGRGFGNYEDRARRAGHPLPAHLRETVPGLRKPGQEPGDHGHPGGQSGMEGRARVRRRRNAVGARPRGADRQVPGPEVTPFAARQPRATAKAGAPGPGLRATIAVSGRGVSVRQIDESAIKRFSDVRFRSEYDYALFEYHRSAKVIAYLEQAGVSMSGRILDAGCGGGGMPVSFAEEAQSARGHRPHSPVQGRGHETGRRARCAERVLRRGQRDVAAVSPRVLRPGPVARRDRARGRCGPLSAGVPTRAEAGRSDVSCRRRRTSRSPARICRA